MTEKHKVTFVLIPFAESSLQAFKPSKVSGSLITIFFAISFKILASLSIPSQSTAVTSALTGPLISLHISFKIVFIFLFCFAINEGFVVIPSTNFVLLISLISLISEESMYIFINKS